MTKRVWAIVDQTISFFLPTRIQTFTYYVPAPPARKSGYREKNFDQLASFFIRKGYKLLDLKVIPHSHSPGGFWAIFLLQSNSLKTRDIDLTDEVDDFVIKQLPELIPEESLKAP